MSRLRVTVTTFAFFAGAAAACFLRLPSGGDAMAADRGTSPEVVKLRQEQITTLREASKLVNEMFARGLCPVSDPARIDRLLTAAELDAAAPQARVQILQNAVDVAKKQEEVATQQARAGVAPPLARLEAKSYRLGLEVRLSEETS